MDQLRINGVFQNFILIMNGGGNNRVSEFPDNLANDVVVGNPDPHGLLFALEIFGHIAAGFQNEGERPRDIPPDDFKNIAGNRPRVQGEMMQVTTDKGEIGFLVSAPFRRATFSTAFELVISHPMP